jgi:hypothetical protein
MLFLMVSSYPGVRRVGDFKMLCLPLPGLSVSGINKPAADVI